jgi:hypothetical protein
MNTFFLAEKYSINKNNFNSTELLILNYSLLIIYTLQVLQGIYPYLPHIAF